MVARRNFLLAIALGACAHGAAHRAGEERLSAIDFEGNHGLGDKTLLTGLALHRVLERGGAPDPYQIQVDSDRIRGEYMRKGYLDVDVRSRVERKGDSTTVIYTVEEGPRAMTRVEIIGLPKDVPMSAVRGQLPLEDGKPFDYEVYDLAKPKLLGAVQDAGYARADLDASVIADRAHHTAIVRLDYYPGPKCTFGTVTVTGVSGELAEAVSDRVTFAQGQVYSTQAIVQTQRNLYGFGRFSTVQVQPDKSAGEFVAVHISVSESARHEVKLGGGFGLDTSTYEVRGRAGYSIAGWPYPLDTLSIDLRPAYAVQHDFTQPEPKVRALAKLERQDLLWTYAKGTVEAGYNYLTVEAFSSTGPLARLGFETRLGTERVRLRLGWGIEQVWFRNISPVIDPRRLIAPMPDQSPQPPPPLVTALGIDHGQRIAGYQQALVVDLRDHPIEPTLGAYGELHVTEGTRYAGGQFDYLEVVPDLRGYVPLIGGAVLAAHVRYGAIYPDTDKDVPATERLFSGGANSQRGFAERRLAPFKTGPIDTKGAIASVPYGGTRLVDTSIEARVPITKIRNMPLGVAAFLDGGDVVDTTGVDASNPTRLDLMHLHWAAGLGLRLNTIVGPVRLDVAYRLNRFSPGEPSAGSQFAYHLTIGEAF
jgi:outer membrane protein assembly factor BamA